MTPMQIQNEVRKALAADTRTMREIAALLDMHPVNLSQFKAGDRDLPLAPLFRLAGILGLEIVVRHVKRR